MVVSQDGKTWTSESALGGKLPTPAPRGDGRVRNELLLGEATAVWMIRSSRGPHGERRKAFPVW